MDTFLLQLLADIDLLDDLGDALGPLANMLLAFVVNLAFVWAIIHFLYYRKSHRRDFYFTFLLINIAIFFLMYFMIYVLDDMKGKTGIGIGIGLFGIFSIMRYRTETMPVREMTYLFSIICLSVVNALCAGAETLSPVMLVPDAVVLVAIALCEAILMRGKNGTKLVQYDRIALITPDKRGELLADLRQRTGLDIYKVQVGSIDFLKDMAIVRIYYHSSGDDEDGHINQITKLSKDEWNTVEES